MIRPILVLIFTCACAIVQAQVNFVLNPSFEQYSYCPKTLDEIKFASYWNGIDTLWSSIDGSIYGPICIPDYCNVCSDTTYGYASIPNNAYFYQYPRSGNGLAQTRLLLDSTLHPGVPNIRDYLQGMLDHTLNAGHNYCVTFYVNLAEVSGYAIDKIGAYLDDGSIDMGQDSTVCAKPQTAYLPQVISSSIINDTLSWVKIQGEFVATGSEKFITIGNFSDFTHTNKVVVNYSPHSSDRITFYLVDDVSVIESDAVAYAGHDTTIAHGDSAYIGIYEEGMPCTWYKADSATPIGYSGGIWVRPDTTTKYIVKMDLCSNVTYGAVTVTVNTVGVGNLKTRGFENVKIYPNPAKDNLTIEHAGNSILRIYDLIGKEVYMAKLSSSKETISIKDLPTGVYVAQVADVETGHTKNIRLIKE